MLLSRENFRSDIIFTELAKVSLKATTSNRGLAWILKLGLFLRNLNVLGCVLCERKM